MKTGGHFVLLLSEMSYNFEGFILFKWKQTKGSGASLLLLFAPAFLHQSSDAKRPLKNAHSLATTSIIEED